MSFWHLLLVLLIVLIGVSLKFLPWYVLVGGAVVLAATFWLFGGRLLLWLFSLPFRAKGAVLRGALVEVHLVERTAAPAPRNSDDNVEAETGGPRNYYRCEATITPQASAGPFQFWEPGELALVRPECDLMKDSDDACRVVTFEVQRNHESSADENDDAAGKYFGPQRLHLLLAVKLGVERLVFQYYFEKFGGVVLPEAPVAECTPK